jgi:hypothetical protein
MDKRIPEGFELVTTSGPGVLEVVYRTHGMGCLLSFIGFGVLTLGPAFLGFALLSPEEFKEFVFVERWTPYAFGCGALAIIYWTFFVLFHRFGSTRFVATRSALVVIKSLFFLRVKRSVDRTAIAVFRQVRDGGHEEDSFPSWGLELRGKRTVRLIARQPLEKSDWLGELLSEWFDVPYERCESESRQ